MLPSVVDRALAGLGDDDHVRRAAQRFFDARRADVGSTLVAGLLTGDPARHASLLTLIDSTIYEANRATVDQALAEALGSDEGVLRAAGVVAAGTLERKVHEDAVLRELDRDDAGVPAALALTRLYRDDVPGLLAAIGDRKSTAALLARSAFDDPAAVALLEGRLEGGSIQDLDAGLLLAGLTGRAELYPQVAAQIGYSNARYAPTDYYVAWHAQQAAVRLLLGHPELRQ